MPAPAGTSTAFRLARIAALVLGSLLFLYACENSKSAVLADKWVEVAIAGGLLAAGLGAAWFEIKLNDYRDFDEDDELERAEVRGGHIKSRAEVRTEAAKARAVGRGDRTAGGAAHGRKRKNRWIPGNVRADEPSTGTREFLVESEGWSMRAKIARSGDLIFHGHDLGGTYPAYEWMWVFHSDTFAEIRIALGDDEGDILELLEDVVPQLNRHGRHDPGAWLRTHDIPATYREKGVSATQETRELPLLEPGLPDPTPRRDEPVSPRARRNELPPSRSRRANRNSAPPLDDDSAPIPIEREYSARSRRDAVASSGSRHEDSMPARSRHDESAPARSQWNSAVPTRSAGEDFRSTRSPRNEPEPARSQWNSPARSTRDDFEPTPSPHDQPEPARSQWSSSAREDFGPARSPYEDPTPARSAWEDDPAPSHEDPEPRWPVRDENARPPLERRKRSRQVEPASDWSRHDDSAPAQSPYEDPAEAWARRQRLDAIQAQLEQQSHAQPEQSYRREAAQPQYDSRHSAPDDFLPLQRRGSSAVPQHAEAARYEQLPPPGQRPGPSWPERSMPRQRQAPQQPPQRDEYPWADQPSEYDEPPPARRHRSSPPPNSPGSGRHSASHSASPPWQ
ncbi:hypothetical protein OG203_13285 [Nocardia sp. NBC_01499]|uniref:hypothetical protein n=1 Tax=Nocardia sp. NBC_01499 TaxID=2903597 RepID=UPI00386979FF